MRIILTLDIDGTDEQQLDMLEVIEDYVDSAAILGIYARDEQLDLDMVYVSVVEVPERQVRGPAKQVP
jgi:hypothetical protein